MTPRGNVSRAAYSSLLRVVISFTSRSVSACRQPRDRPAGSDRSAAGGRCRGALVIAAGLVPDRTTDARSLLSRPRAGRPGPPAVHARIAAGGRAALVHHAHGRAD